LIFRLKQKKRAAGAHFLSERLVVVSFYHAAIGKCKHFFNLSLPLSPPRIAASRLVRIPAMKKIDRLGRTVYEESLFPLKQQPEHERLSHDNNRF
jgi:hypothetical protein